MDVKIISSISEIEDAKLGHSIKYSTIHNPNNFFELHWNMELGYLIYGHISGQQPTYVSNGWNIKYWKTFNGVIKAIKKFIDNREWGFQNFFPTMDIK